MQLRHYSVAALLSFGVVGCLPGEGDDSTPTPCEADFECDVGFVCDADLGECAAADAGTQREFGRVTLDASGEVDERHLLVVYAVPTADAAGSTNNPTVTLVAVGSDGSGALRPVPRANLVSPLTPAWRDRLLAERLRRDRLDRLVSALNAGSATLYPAQGRQVDGCTATCDDTAMCRGSECLSAGIELTLADGSSTVTCNLVAVLTDPSDATRQINVLLDETDDAADASNATYAETAAQGFLDTWADQQEILGVGGHSGDLDRDHDGRLTVVFSSAIGTTNVGYFDLADFLEDGTTVGGVTASGNQADLLWANLPVDGEEAHWTGTLAHEYTHLASFARRVYGPDNQAMRELLWLDEGLAHLMEDLTGWGGSNISTVQSALDNWSSSGFALAQPDTLEQEFWMRGQAYLFLRHQIDSAGADDAISPATMAAAADLVSGLISENAVGFDHAAFQGSGDIVGDWLQAVYTTGNDDATLAAAHAFDYLDVAANTDTGYDTGMDTHAEFATPRDGPLSLTGPSLEGLTEVPSDQDSALEPLLMESGAVFYELTDFTAGSVEISGSGEAQYDLRLRLVRVN